MDQAFGDQVFHRRASGARGVKGDRRKPFLLERLYRPSGPRLRVSQRRHGNGSLSRLHGHPSPVLRHSHDGSHGIGQYRPRDRIWASEKIAHRKDHSDIPVAHVGANISGGDGRDDGLGKSERKDSHGHRGDCRPLIPPQTDRPVDPVFAAETGKKPSRAFPHRFHDPVPLPRSYQGGELPAALAGHFLVRYLRPDGGRTQGADVDHRRVAAQGAKEIFHGSHLGALRIESRQNGDIPFPGHFQAPLWGSLTPVILSRSGPTIPSSPWGP